MRHRLEDSRPVFKTTRRGHGAISDLGKEPRKICAYDRGETSEHVRREDGSKRLQPRAERQDVLTFTASADQDIDMPIVVPRSQLSYETRFPDTCFAEDERELRLPPAGALP